MSSNLCLVRWTFDSLLSEEQCCKNKGIGKKGNIRVLGTSKKILFFSTWPFKMKAAA